MTDTIFNVDAADFAQALILLSLDELAGSAKKMNAPELKKEDRDSLREWLSEAPNLNQFPFNIDMTTDFPRLQKRIPPARVDPITHWAVSSAGLHDPSSDRTNWPQHAMYDWMRALQSALEEKALEYLDLPTATRLDLEKLIATYGKAIEAGDATSHPLVKSWDPHDPRQIDDNSQNKTPWDLHVYTDYCIPRSVILAFALGQIFKNQADRAFIIAYSQGFDTATHAAVRDDLPQAIKGVGLYALHPWQLENLTKHAAHTPETLLPYAAMRIDL